VTDKITDDRLLLDTEVTPWNSYPDPRLNTHLPVLNIFSRSSPSCRHIQRSGVRNLAR